MGHWLLFFAVPVLHGILPSAYLSHLALLVMGIHILSSSNIMEHDFLQARCLLRQFHVDFSVLYGKKIGEVWHAQK